MDHGMRDKRVIDKGNIAPSVDTSCQIFWFFPTSRG